MDNFNQLEIPGTDGWYHATCDGRIWSCKTGRFLKPVINRQTGYYMVILYLDGAPKVQSVHRLVALTFIDKVEGRDVVDHINGVRSDNCIENLRWVNHSLNQHNKSSTKGYSFDKRTNKWRAIIMINYKFKSLGYFDTEQEARDAYLEAKSKLIKY